MHYRQLIIAALLTSAAPYACGQGLVAQMQNGVLPIHGASNLPATANIYRARGIVPPNLYTQHLGFFCRQELRIQRANLPIAFRLGSMAQCNMLEQKPGYR